MKGTLHKTNRGWVVKQVVKEGPDAKLINQYPLIDNGHIDGLKLYDSNEGLEVDFEIVDEIIDLGRNGSTVVEKAKLVSKEYLVNAPWLTMKEGDITVNFIPMPEFDEPEYPTKLHQLQIQAAEACFRKYPNNEDLYSTDELKDAYKAGVIDGLREWRLDSYDKAMAEPIVLYKTLTLHFEVYHTDLEEMSWYQAKEACANLGNGWRLPTKDEINLIYENKDMLGGFVGGNYWSSTECLYNYAWGQYFNNGLQNYYYKGSEYNVRAVRAITKQTRR